MNLTFFRDNFYANIMIIMRQIDRIVYRGRSRLKIL